MLGAPLSGGNGNVEDYSRLASFPYERVARFITLSLLRSEPVIQPDANDRAGVDEVLIVLVAGRKE